MKILSAIIIDDEQAAIEALKQEIRLFTPLLKVVGEATTLKKAAEIIEDKNPLIIFLDIQLHQEIGFELFNTIDSNQYYVIFTTAFMDYAIEAIKKDKTK